MKKQLLNILFCGMLLVPFETVWAQSTVDAGQTTEGKDFWVTFLKADQDANNNGALQLSISAREACEVTIENPYTNYVEHVSVAANEMQLVTLYEGSVFASTARNNMNASGKVCYAVNMFLRTKTFHFLRPTTSTPLLMLRTYCLLHLCWTNISYKPILRPITIRKASIILQEVPISLLLRQRMM